MQHTYAQHGTQIITHGCRVGLSMGVTEIPRLASRFGALGYRGLYALFLLVNITKTNVVQTKMEVECRECH